MSDIFSLEQVYRSQIKREWDEKKDVYLSYIQNPFPYAYFGGGSSLGRINYNNDTNLSVDVFLVPKQGSSASGNLNYGYFAGGTPGPLSTVERIDYANDTSQATTKGDLFTPRSYLASVGNLTYGYFGGGSTGPLSSIDRLDYSSDTSQLTPRGSIVPFSYLSASGNQSFGYFAGGINENVSNSYTSLVQRIDYSNDNVLAQSKGPLADARSFLASTGNNSYGFFGGGLGYGSGEHNKSYLSATFDHTTIDRLDYSNDTVRCSYSAVLLGARHSLSATGNSSFGYFVGGAFTNTPSYSVIGTGQNISSNPLLGTPYFTTPLPAYTTYSGVIEKLNYDNDSFSSYNKGQLSTSQTHLSACSSAENALYLNFPSIISQSPYSNVALLSENFPQSAANVGRFCYVFSDIVSKLDYSNDTNNTKVSATAIREKFKFFVVGNANYAYGSEGTSSINRISYTNDATYSLRFSYCQISSYSDDGQNIAFGNNSYGYITSYDSPGGAASQSYTRGLFRIDYSNDSSLTSPRSMQTAPVIRSGYTAATSNKDYGYVYGGRSGLPSASGGSAIHRFDFSNDLDGYLSRGTLSISNQLVKSASSSPSHGYIYAQNPSNVTVFKFDYLNDTASIPSVATSSLRTIRSSNGNELNGYIFYSHSIDFSNDVDKINYSSDTISVLSLTKFYGTDSSASLCTAATIRREMLTSSSPQSSLKTYRTYLRNNRGYVHLVNRCRRIDFNNDTQSTVLKAYFASTRNQEPATITTNSSEAYVVGGTLVPQTEKYDYSSETASASTQISIDNVYIASVGNVNSGYFLGGSISGNTISTIERLNYSSGTSQIITSKMLYPARYNKGTNSNQNFGYVHGADFISGPITPQPAGYSAIQRINFSNDAVTLLTSTLFPFAGNGSVGNSNFGYVLSSSDSSIQRITYANDTLSLINCSGFLVEGGDSGNSGGTGNEVLAFFLGSFRFLYRFNYSNDTLVFACGNAEHMRRTQGLTSNDYVYDIDPSGSEYVRGFSAYQDGLPQS